MTATFDWFFLLAGNIFVLLGLYLIFSPYGKIRLGGPDATPDFNYSVWFAMRVCRRYVHRPDVLVAFRTPISHYTSSIAANAGTPESWAPLGGAAGNEAEAKSLAMAATIFHWALHPWAIYAIVALALALFSYNKGLPLAMRSVFYPIFGERVWGWTGHIIDILAVLATLFGLATSLGIGAEQANAGLNHIFGLPVNDLSKVLLIVAITGIALTSVIAGMDSGVKRLSEINMVLAGLLLLFVIIVGPTLYIFRGLVSNFVDYARYLPELANPFGRTDKNFMDGWTSFYWAWWISWSPFVGMFIARVSRGRTVREFVTCVSDYTVACVDCLDDGVRRHCDQRNHRAQL